VTVETRLAHQGGSRSQSTPGSAVWHARTETSAALQHQGSRLRSRKAEREPDGAQVCPVYPPSFFIAARSEWISQDAETAQHVLSEGLNVYRSMRRLRNTYSLKTTDCTRPIPPPRTSQLHPLHCTKRKRRSPCNFALPRKNTVTLSQDSKCVR